MTSTETKALERTAVPPGAFAVALGAGGARGLAHIVVLEAFDELGIRPAVIAGASIGALVGAAYAAGMCGKHIRALALDTIANRNALMAALIGARVRRSVDLAVRGNPFLLDSERLLARLWPASVPGSFEDLLSPLHVIATDYSRRSERVFTSGPLLPALASSIAIPGLVKPVRVGSSLFVDGGATDPLPFDTLMGRAEVTLAVDVTGVRTREQVRTPGRFETMFGTLQIMQAAIVAAKLRVHRPQIVIRPAVDHFRLLEFNKARAILAAAEPIKDELKRRIEERLASM